MTHLSEDSRRLAIQYIVLEDNSPPEQVLKLDDVCLLVLPERSLTDRAEPIAGLDELLNELLPHLGPRAMLITLGEPIDLAHVHAAVSPLLNYQLWVAIKRTTSRTVGDHTALPEQHFGALVHTRYPGTLQHTKTRVQYSYCPACDKTTKDYGGKKHTYNSYGTLLSDIWRDIAADLSGDLSPVVERFADLFGLGAYRELVVLDCRSRYFLYLETVLTFQSWIAWDALSFPVRMIMPAHYAIVCFSKGKSRPLPGLTGEAGMFDLPGVPPTFQPLRPMADEFCLRARCVKARAVNGPPDRAELTDLWSDIHRLKHNSRRVDHPCQLPPQLLYRLISIFTKPGEVVLDCFNGAGTTTLSAHQLRRRYIGVELSEKYHTMAVTRHQEIMMGLDPFRKEQRQLTEKNSPVERMPKRQYEVPKKVLQLEVRRVAQTLDRLPSRDDMIQWGKYPIRYYDEYFASWGEVCAAARHDGMTETRTVASGNGAGQLSLFDLGSEDARRRK